MRLLDPSPRLPHGWLDCAGNSRVAFPTTRKLPVLQAIVPKEDMNKYG